MNSAKPAFHIRRIVFPFAFTFSAGALIAILAMGTAPAIAHAQQPTGSIPTVTGTPAGPIVRVDPSVKQIRIYAGPSSFDYPAVGVLLGGETAPALARASGKEEWIKIYYVGVPGSNAWVFGLYVSLSPGALLPVIEAPPTPTPFSTPTLDPTLEAAFIGQQTPTRLPTFTPPPPLEAPSFEFDANSQPTAIPAGLIILVLGLFGFFGATLSYLRGR
ncbi:MAG: hypothetical protein IT312_13905 [Anaerolineales bacterium]|nr:hypothetical protein [Anaerolineales bacterium]